MDPTEIISEPVKPCNSDEDATPPPAPSSQLTNLLEEAREFYGPAVCPPFVTTKKNNQPGDTRSLVLATDEGKYPQAPVKRVDLVYWRWNDRYLFTTIELNGSTHIVKSISGGASGSVAGGAAFKLWRGPEEGFSKLSIAFPDKGPMGAATPKIKAAASTRLSAPSTDPPPKKILRASKPIRHSDSGIVFNWTSVNGNAYSPRVNAHHGSTRKAQEATSSSESSSSSDSDGSSDIDQLLRLNSSARQVVKDEPRESHDLLTPGTSLPGAFSSPDQDNANSQGTNPRPSANPLDPEEADKLLVQMRDGGKTWKGIRDTFDKITGQKSGTSTWWYRYDRIKSKEATPLRNNAAHSKQGESSKRPLKGHQGSSDDETDDVIVKRTPVKRKFRPSQHARLTQGAAEDRQVKGGNLLAAKRLSRLTSGTQPPRLRFRAVNSTYSPASPLYLGEAGAMMSSSEPTMASMPPLAPHKLDRTKLRISHSGSFTPLKLRSCTTMPGLFNSVLNICSLTDHRDNVEALKATFTWIPEKDSSRSMLLKEEFVDSFEFLLEAIDEAPCWETENGKCTVDIEVVHRIISGEPLQKAWLGAWPASDIN